MKILLVDDSRTMRNIEKNVLKVLESIAFVEAGDGVEALAALEAEAAAGPVELMLVDWNMPNMDGLTFVKRVREKDKRTPIVMVTTEAERTAILDAIRAGVNDYVVKPFTPNDLLQRVHRTLAKYGITAAAS